MDRWIVVDLGWLSYSRISYNFNSFIAVSDRLVLSYVSLDGLIAVL